MLTRRWGVLHGDWWMVQYALDGTLSFGIHIDPVRRRGDTSDHGPYIDLHLGVGAVSLGRHPARAWNFSLMRPECQQ
jgi:hypothetical protein